MIDIERKRYSYQECWNHALTFQKDIEIEKVKNDIIALCQTVPENFWLNFSNKLLSSSAYLKTCRNLEKYLKETYPVPYLTKQVSFYGLFFHIKKGIFIPQKDTEILVEKTLELIDKYWKKEKLKVLEIGTGCGNIVISVAKNKPDWKFTAIDVNKEALKVAQTNATNHQIKNIKFTISNLFKNIGNKKKFDVIISNPPYISNDEYKNISLIAKKQPKKSLVAENNGLYFYQEIFRKAQTFLRKKFLLIVEIGYQQVEKVIKLVIKYFPDPKEVFVFFDWAGRSRVIAIRNK